MTKRKYIRLALFSFLMLAGSIALVPQFIHLGNTDTPQSIVKIDSEANLDTAPDAENEQMKYEKPVYFNLFKFIGSFVPNRQRQSGGL